VARRRFRLMAKADSNRDHYEISLISQLQPLTDTFHLAELASHTGDHITPYASSACAHDPSIPGYRVSRNLDTAVNHR
jgi:hypothetical protein